MGFNKIMDFGSDPIIVIQKQRYGDDYDAVTSPIKCEPNTLYWLTELTPHESLPSVVGSARQFVRIVGEKVGVWFSKHDTFNPLIPISQYPRISDIDKFKAA